MQLPPLPEPKKSNQAKEKQAQRVKSIREAKQERKKIHKELEKQKALKQAEKEGTIARIESEISEEQRIEREALRILKRQEPIVPLEIVEKAPEVLTEDITSRPIAFQPWPRGAAGIPGRSPQMDFMEALEDQVLFGGGRGSGKTECFIADPLQYVHNPNFRALVLRRTMGELQSLIDRSAVMYRAVIPKVQYKVKEKVFVFPSGAKIEYGYLDTEQDLERYRGQQYTWLGIDELSMLPDFMWVMKLLGSLRTSDPTQKTYFRATTNWVGIGVDWVKEYFHVEEEPEGKTIREKRSIKLPDGTEHETTLTKKWINSTVFDNPALANDPTFIASLNSMPEHLRKALLFGDTTSIEGAAFPDFQKEVHVCEPFEIPPNWKRYRGCDYGYGDGAACVWIAISPDDITYVYREVVVNGRNTAKRYTCEEFTQLIIEAETDSIRYGAMDKSMWNNRGGDPSYAEIMAKMQVFWRPSDNSKGSRVVGKNRIHELLRTEEKLKKPKLIFFKNCMQCIKMMQGIPLDKKNAEDVDTDSPLDHQYDALRYVLMSRPTSYAGPLIPLPPRPFNSQFGY